jgi:tetratricopeptide (TPR) repeat protein
MKSLLAYSLIESHQHTESYSLHPVMHDWCTETISCGKGDLTVAALIVVGTAAPDHSEAEYWLSQQRLLPHANRCVRHMDDLDVLDQLRSVDAGYALHNLGILYADQGKHAEAKKMYRRALDGKEKASGTGHTSTLDIVNNLRLLNANQGEHIKVEDIHPQRPNSNDAAHGTD